MKWLDRKINDFITRIRDSDRKPIPIGPDPENPTYWRWFVVPRNPYFNLYLHHFLQDDAEDLHDHRMMNISIILQGWYFEERFVWKPKSGLLYLPNTCRRVVNRLTPLLRLPSTPHRVILDRVDGKPVPIWSLFIGFPHWRSWGFYILENGVAKWVPHELVVANPDPTSSGYGRKA